MNLDVYAFGSALIDIQVHVKDSLLSEIGVEKGNMYLTERERQEEIVTALLGGTSLELDQVRERLHTAAGGSAANTVFGVADLGGQGGLCGKVARDRFGTLYTELMVYRDDIIDHADSNFRAKINATPTTSALSVIDLYHYLPPFSLQKTFIFQKPASRKMCNDYPLVSNLKGI